jgi:trans-aconitate 2-methyltransferase
MAWNPEKYLSFANIRFRAAMDLIERIPHAAFKRIYDLGSGTGHVTNILQERWPTARVTATDNSPEMLTHFHAEFPKLECLSADIRSWRASEAPDLIFSNAALQWVPGHETLFAGLLGQLNPGGWLAVQMPRHTDDPGHLLIMETAGDPRWRDRFDQSVKLRVHSAEEYWKWLKPNSQQVDVWETIYHHELEGENPVVNFFLGSQLRPYLDKLSETERQDFLGSYGEKVARAYPRQANGKTLFPFRRIFILAQRNSG